MWTTPSQTSRTLGPVSLQEGVHMPATIDRQIDDRRKQVRRRSMDTSQASFLFSMTNALQLPFQAIYVCTKISIGTRKTAVKQLSFKQLASCKSFEERWASLTSAQCAFLTVAQSHIKQRLEAAHQPNLQNYASQASAGLQRQSYPGAHIQAPKGL